MAEITTVLTEVERIVRTEGRESDIAYFQYHRRRFRRMAESIAARVAPGATIMDIGSHYLHSSMILSRLGYKVVGVDVPEFWNMDFVARRGRDFGIAAVAEHDLASAASIRKIDGGSLDAILFTEIMEHITFNPVNFWKLLCAKLTQRGIIYISTPNSLRTMNIARTMRNLVLRRGVGLHHMEVLRKVTYGHHWKEYSKHEMQAYFQALNDGFAVEVGYYRYKDYPPGGPRAMLTHLIARVGDALPPLNDELEAIVHLSPGHEWKLEAPQY